MAQVAAGFALPRRAEDHVRVAEYVLLLAASAGTQVLAGVDRTLRQDTLLWAGAGLVVLLVAGWLLRPRRW